MNKPLTPTDIQTIEGIHIFMGKYHHSPSIRDLARILGITATPTWARLRILRDKGYVDWRDRKARTLRVIKER